MSAKLIAISFINTPRINCVGLSPRAFESIKCDEPMEQLKGWHVRIRGPMMLFVSPPGWKANPNSPSIGDDSICVQVPMNDVTPFWRGSPADIEKALLKFDSEPFGKPVEVVAEAPSSSLLAQLPVGVA